MSQIHTNNDGNSNTGVGPNITNNNVPSLYTGYNASKIKFERTSERLRDLWRSGNVLISQDCAPKVREDGSSYVPKAFALLPDYVELFRFLEPQPPEAKVYYEAIEGKSPQKPHFDLDFPIEKYPAMTREFAYECLQAVLDAIRSVLSSVQVEYSFAQNCLVFSSHGLNKQSFHIVLDRFCHENHREAKAFYRQVLAAMPSEMQALNFLDGMVYSSFQNFRLLGCQKRGSGRPKVVDSITTYVPFTLALAQSFTPDPRLQQLENLKSSLVSFTADCALLPSFLEREPCPSYDSPAILSRHYDEMLGFFETQPYAAQYNLHDARPKGNGLFINRNQAGMCPIHHRSHDSVGAVIIMDRDGNFRFRCFGDDCGIKRKDLQLGYTSLELEASSALTNGEPVEEDPIDEGASIGGYLLGPPKPKVLNLMPIQTPAAPISIESVPSLESVPEGSNPVSTASVSTSTPEMNLSKLDRERGIMEGMPESVKSFLRTPNTETQANSSGEPPPPAIRTLRLMPAPLPTFPLRYSQYTFDGDATWHGFLGWIANRRFQGDSNGNLTSADRHVILTELSKCYALIVNGSKPMALYRGNSDCLYALQGTPKEYPQVFWVSQPNEIIMGVVTPVPDRPIKITNFCRYIEEISYNGITMEPYHLDQPKTSNSRFNTFSGFKARLTHPDPQPEDMAKIQIILDHIRTVWAGGNEDLYWYILSWFAYPIRTLKAAQKVLVITGLPGCGKSRVFDFFDVHVYGDALSHTYKDLSGMDGNKFNDVVIGKMRVHVSEIVSEGQTHVSGTTWNKLKDQITGRTVTCHPIYCAEYTIPNVITWSFTSNHDDCIMLENEDRRYIVIKCTETYKGNRDYFHTLSAAFTDEAGSIMYSYLRSDAFGEHMIDIPTEAIPITQVKLDMIASSRPILWDFISDVFETGSYDIPSDFIHNITKEDGAAFDQFISSADLYKLYSDWARSTGNKVQPQRAISNFIKSIARFTHAEKRVGCGNKNQKGFFIPEAYRGNISILDTSFISGAIRTARGNRTNPNLRADPSTGTNSHAATSGH